MDNNLHRHPAPELLETRPDNIHGQFGNQHNLAGFDYPDEMLTCLLGEIDPDEPVSRICWFVHLPFRNRP
jgi:hypothetical protein